MRFMYRNHRNETEERYVTPVALVYLSNPGKISKFLQSYMPGWFLECITHDRGDDVRHFALMHIEETEKNRPEGSVRLSLPTGLFDTHINPYPPGVATIYRDGFKAGHTSEPFDFDRIAEPDGGVWAHGYNDGRRRMLDGVLVAPSRK